MSPMEVTGLVSLFIIKSVGELILITAEFEGFNVAGQYNRVLYGLFCGFLRSSYCGQRNFDSELEEILGRIAATINPQTSMRQRRIGDISFRLYTTLSARRIMA